MLLPPGDPGARDWVALTESPLEGPAATGWASTPECGAVVCFLGIVRDHADGRSGVEAITYEAYADAAERALHDVVADTRRRWPALGRIALVHRTGRLALSEASVLVVVAAPHRAEAFDAARHCIDTLKETVPVWKQEHSGAGSAWVPGTPVRRVSEGAPAKGR